MRAQQKLCTTEVSFSAQIENNNFMEMYLNPFFDTSLIFHKCPKFMRITLARKKNQ